MQKLSLGSAEENVWAWEEKVTEVSRKLLNEDRNKSYLSPYIIKWSNEGSEMDGQKRNSSTIWLQKVEERAHLEDLVVDYKTVLK